MYQAKFVVTGEEYRELQAMADYLYREKALETPRVSAAAKAAMFKFYNELNSVLLSGRRPTQAKIRTGQGHQYKTN